MERMKRLFLGLYLVAVMQAAPVAERLGFQLYSLRETFEKDPVQALDRTRDFGFTFIETYSLHGMSAQDLRARFDERGLKAVSMHVAYERLKKDMPGVIAEAKALGASYVTLPWLPDERFDQAVVERVLAEFNSFGRQLKQAGLRFVFHPHGYEFLPVNGRDGRNCFEELADTTNPDLVFFELDVFWASNGGVDPVKLLEEYPGRWVLLHIKDRRVGARDAPGTRSAPVADKVAVGTGRFDWPTLLRKADECGVQYYFLEDESADPAVTIEASLRYLRGLGAGKH
jgi:sugar phosphate isomerase/epimerase